MSGSEQFRGNLRTFLHNQLSGDSGKLIDGDDVIDSEDGLDGSDVIDSESSNDGSDVIDSGDGGNGGRWNVSSRFNQNLKSAKSWEKSFRSG